jgi:hypothetical protein
MLRCGPQTFSVQAIIINLPSVGAALDVPASRQQWIVSAYNLTFGCFLVCIMELNLLHPTYIYAALMGSPSRHIRPPSHLPLGLSILCDYLDYNTIRTERNRLRHLSRVARPGRRRYGSNCTRYPRCNICSRQSQRYCIWMLWRWCTFRWHHG